MGLKENTKKQVDRKITNQKTGTVSHKNILMKRKF